LRELYKLGIPPDNELFRWISEVLCESELSTSSDEEL